MTSETKYCECCQKNMKPANYRICNICISRMEKHPCLDPYGCARGDGPCRNCWENITGCDAYTGEPLPLLNGTTP